MPKTKPLIKNNDALENFEKQVEMQRIKRATARGMQKMEAKCAIGIKSIDYFIKEKEHD